MPIPFPTWRPTPFVKITGVIIAAALILIGVVNFSMRNEILNRKIAHKIAYLHDRYGLNITYERLSMKGLSQVELQNLCVVPENRDTILQLGNLTVHIELLPLLAARIDVDRVRVKDLLVNFVKRDSVANYDFLFKTHSDTPESYAPRTAPPTDYSATLVRVTNLIFGLLPQNGVLENLKVIERKDSNYVSMGIQSAEISHHTLSAPIEICEDSVCRQWKVTCRVNRHSESINMMLSANDGLGKISLPYITRRFGATVSFDTLSCSFAQTRSSGVVDMAGHAQILGLDLYHKALSPETINLDDGLFDYSIHVGKNRIELDSATTIRFNRMAFNPYIMGEKNNGKWHLRLSVNKPWFPADDLFGSLPKGLFLALEGIRTQGELAYHFLADVDFASVDSLKFESSLTPRNFKIEHYGTADLGKMSREFTYTAFENGRAVRSFPVGPSWEHFAPLDTISPLLRMSVLQSEDGEFFYHNGFLLDALREAIIHDLKVGKFARGGSTISMQLVKNVFLNRNKNIARKIEEALIVWLIESQHLTSKQRMFEVYLNIAEWGPGIYGVTEASRFYFNKSPWNLTLEESIFMASIIPKPKRFRSSFTADMQLHGWLGSYFRRIAGKLYRKGLISEHEADSIYPYVILRGDATQSFTPRDTLSIFPINDLQSYEE